ncbi:MAG: 1-deoxy-D-xylulose-5-phosphate synthase [Muribaculaceae bacterium]|nr:1-deoxy-D-xylulose-5-phosphate synthase [Muribaculaceae bacterium]
MSKDVRSESVNLLSTIESPADVRRLKVEQLPQLCDEIRQFLIEHLSVNPGHFASSMGAVELTVALHYVFNTPYDRLVWDVGHQAYGHKLLTGRRDAFNTNRTMGGLSGFPNPDESEYDTFSAGHASNSISAALGMAVASRLKGESPRRNVVAITGDASISGGLAFEGLNNAANTPNDLLIILNDNDMSIDANVGALNGYLAQLTTSRLYNDLRYKCYKGMRKLHLVSEGRRGALLRFNNSLKSLINKRQNIFEGLNIRYFGPFYGHDVVTIVRVLTDIRDMDGPRMLHLRTVKGKGYAPAEADPASWHAPGRFDSATGEKLDKSGPDTPPKYQDVFGHTLLELARADSSIVAITAAMLSGTSVSVMQAVMPDRVFDVGISEGHAVTFAGGLAKDGMRPVVAIYSSFLQRAYDNIINDIALQRLPVIFCIDRAGLVGEDGATHHGALDLAYMRAVPGMTVCAPSSGDMLRRLMYTAEAHTEGPIAIRYPRGRCREKCGTGPVPPLPVGRGERICEGSDVAVLTIGTVLDDARTAVKKARDKDIGAALYDMIFLKPLDEQILEEVAAKGCPVITVEDGTIDGGLGSAVSDWFASRGLSTRIVRLGIPDKFIPHATPAQQHKMCGFDSEAILDTIEQLSGRV